MAQQIKVNAASGVAWNVVRCRTPRYSSP